MWVQSELAQGVGRNIRGIGMTSDHRVSVSAGRTRALRAVAGLLAASAAVGAHAATFIDPGSLLISSTTYANVGQVATLAPGTTNQLPGKMAGVANAVMPVSNGNYATVFNNASVDGSFGVASAITLQDFNAATGVVNHMMNIAPSVVVTSFPSKSELSLNVANTSTGSVVTFMGYAGAAVGQLDISNSDTTAYKDTTNPVSAYFGTANNGVYAFNRSVVAVTDQGAVSSTQTLAYGGNNGRAAVLASNGNYYTVGNSNNGTGTPTQITTSTGLEVVTPGATANSTMVAPDYQSVIGDKAGKDSNFRGLTLYNGNLYVAKGSGGNGIDTVYAVSSPNGALPTAATVGAATLAILPGFATDVAKTSGGNFTPFGLFFANDTTLYVADEGSGNTTDASAHAGLEKWSLVGGTWQLDYTLQSGLIGQMYTVSGTNSGVAGSWPTVTTSGLRDLAGRVNADGTVSLWAVTATTSASGDNGADPNSIVAISDVLGATVLPTSETFSTFAAAQYGVRYGGVAFAADTVPEPATWAMLLVGMGGVGTALRSRRRSAAVAA